MSGIGENELVREGCRLLRKLVDGAVLQPLADGGFAMVRRARRLTDARLRVSRDLAAALVARDLLQRRGDGALVVSDAGRGWYLRQTCSDKTAVDPFAAQHRILSTVKITGGDGRATHVALNAAESPLAVLRRRNLVDADAFEAGERLRRDYTLAQLTPRMGVDLSAPCVFGRRAVKPDYLPETVLAAKQRFSAAMRAVGPEFAGLLFDVCCDLRGLTACEKGRGWPRASAKVVLNLALEKLARHYGIGQSVAHAPLRGWAQAPKARFGKVEP
jgi:hypothetical protein